MITIKEVVVLTGDEDLPGLRSNRGELSHPAKHAEIRRHKVKDQTTVEHCSKCGKIIGTSYFSAGERYCSNCMFDGSGRFVDSISTQVRYWGPTADAMKRIEEGTTVESGQSPD